MSPKVGIILLNYNNAIDTIECFKNLRKISYDNFQIVIVDNHSTDDSLEFIKAEIKDEKLLKSDTNKGYAAGNNIGIQYCLSEKCDYLCILNNDVKVASNFLDILVETMSNNDSIGIAGPKICDYDDPDNIQSIGSTVNMNFGRATELFKNQNSKDVVGKIIDCDYVGGACMLVRKEVIDNIGLIPEEYFLFYEENEWCQKAKKAGYKIVGVSDSVIWHKGSHTINQISGLSEYFMYRNLVVFIKNNGNLKNKLIFNMYFIAFCVKSLFTKKHGARFIKYYLDGLTGHNKYLYLQK